MNSENQNSEIIADRRADKKSMLFVALFTTLSWIVLSISLSVGIERADVEMGTLDPWLTEFTSHASILVAVILIPVLLSRVPLTPENWKRRIPAYLLGFLAFSFVHISLMIVSRKLSFPMILGRPYEDNPTDILLWLYEIPKDFYTFVLILSIFVAGRYLEQLRLESVNAKREAKATGQLMLKSGGRLLFVGADEILRADAASNYLEIETDTGKHLVRMTLSTLEKLIAETGETHIRVHRSHLVKKEAIREYFPTRDGSAKITLKHGGDLPVGRKYRENVRSIA